MSEQTGRRRGRGALVVLLVAVLAVVLAVTTDLALQRPPRPPAGPAGIAPPPGLDLPQARPAPAVVDAAPTAPVAPEAVRRALAGPLADPDLGRHVVASVAGIDGGPRWELGGTGPGRVAVPASTTKVVTAAAALLALEPEDTFTTRVVADRPGRVVLVGGGDPFLAASPPEGGEDAYPPVADVADLARQSARALRADGVRAVRVGYDDTLFSGPAVSPRWPATYLPDVVTPIHALWVDQGVDGSGLRVADPPRSAADAYAAALRGEGIRVRGAPAPVTAPAAARDLASVESAPLAAVVEQVLRVSDNEGAEVLLRHVGLATGRAGSFDGGRAGVREELAAAGVDLAAPSVLWDGSGLSRENLLDPDLLVDVLQLAASEDRPDLRPVVTGLPVAGFDGSLADRFDTGDPRAPGRVRAKTGTLSNVFGLAGLAVGADGRPVAFALLADRIRLPRTSLALQAMDRAAAALAGCRCTR